MILHDAVVLVTTAFLSQHTVAGNLTLTPMALRLHLIHTTSYADNLRTFNPAPHVAVCAEAWRLAPQSTG